MIMFRCTKLENFTEKGQHHIITLEIASSGTNLGYEALDNILIRNTDAYLDVEQKKWK